MGKERVEKKEKKEKRSDKDGVKKSKKDKKVKVVNEDAVAQAVEEQLSVPVAEVTDEVVMDDGELASKPVGALVPFAAPLADDKVAKKVLKSVKKGKSCHPSHPSAAAASTIPLLHT